MRINLDVQILDIDGEPVMLKRKNDAGEVTKIIPQTAQRVCAEALVAFDPAERTEPLEKSIRGLLALRIMKEKEAEMSAEDIVRTKDCVGRHFGPLIVSQVFPLLKV